MPIKRVLRTRRLCALAIATGCIATSALTAREAPPAAVRDLDYGDVLFHFYQGDQFGALARLLAAEKEGRIQYHADDAELLLGGLYLSFGLHNEAAQRFERLLTDAVPAQSRDRAWYYLASIRAQRGYTSDALTALQQVAGALPEDLAAQKLMLHARVLMTLERHAEAVALLDGWKGPDEWRDYARFNLGVALVRDGQTNSGLRLLEKTGEQRKPRTSEALALRDRANLALGFTYLRDGDALAARPALQRVRLEGPFSNKALLGLGWADSSLHQYDQALVPWQELARRDAIDPAVQESLLAVPHAFAQLDAQSAAAQAYLDAVTAYEAEIERIDGIIATTQSGGLPDRLLKDDRSPVNGWFWRLEAVAENLESRYLADLLANDAFQEALQDYRDLKQSAQNLRLWQQNLTAYDAMVRARQARFEQQLPVVDAHLAADTLDQLSRRAAALNERVEQIAANGDLRALASAGEAALWKRLEAATERVEGLGNGVPAASDARAKLRVFKGLMLWDANARFPERLWARRKAVKNIQSEVAAAAAQRTLLADARAMRPAGFGALDQRITDSGQRIDSLYQRTIGLIAGQEQQLVAMAVTELDLRRERIEAYRKEAQFALATIYDRAAQARLGAQQ